MKDDKEIFKDILTESMNTQEAKAMLNQFDIEINHQLDKSSKSMDVQLISECVDAGISITGIQYPKEGMDKQKEIIMERARKMHKPFSKKRLSKVAVIFCACSASLLLLNTISVQAFQINIFDEIVEFGKDIIKFNFSDNEQPKPIKLITSDGDPYGLKNECNKYQLMPLLPSYIPPDYQLYNFKLDEAEGLRKDITILFKNEEKTISFDISFYQDDNIPELILPNKSQEIEKLNMNGIDVYLLNQGSYYEAMFRYKNTTYSITSSVNHEEFIKIIKSMK